MKPFWSSIFALLLQANRRRIRKTSANIEEIRLVGTESQKKFFFERILQGERLGNAAVEAAGKNVRDLRTMSVPDGD
jgi:alkylation response protein AidB-like acyl-CoA dehydrogenase